MKQFEVYEVNFNPAKGSEIKKSRPAVIISPDAMNKNLKTVIVAPLTHTIKDYPTRVDANFAGQRGQVALDQIRAVDKTRLSQKKGQLDVNTSKDIKAILTAMFS